MKGLKSFSVCLFLLFAFIGSAQEQKRVFVFEVKGEINPVSNLLVSKALVAADSSKADFVVVELNTYGGAVGDADEIVTNILNYDKPIYVWINNTAGSAGSFISVGCDSIYMNNNSVIGASTVVNQTGEVVAEKYQSFMRSKFRSAAEATGKDPELCEQFVGKNLGTDSAVVLSLTTAEAIDTGLCVAQVSRIEEIFIKKGMENIEVIRYNQSTEDKIIGFFTHPAIKSFLVLLIIGGLYYELKTPGLGFPIIAAGIGVVLYFVPDYLEGALEHWELLVFVIGVILLILEAFVIPGFGVAGVSGIVLILLSLILSMVRNDFFNFELVLPGELLGAVSVASIGMAGLVGMIFAAGPLLRRSKYFQSLTVTEVITEKAFKEEQQAAALGEEVEVYSVLRPEGKVIVRGKVVEAIVNHGFVSKGEKVKVVGYKRNKLIVEKIDD